MAAEAIRWTTLFFCSSGGRRGLFDATNVVALVKAAEIRTATKDQEQEEDGADDEDEEDGLD